MRIIDTLAEYWIVEKLREHWLTTAFVAGFVIDTITLNRIDQFFDNAILALYVVLAMVALLLLYASAARKLPGKLGGHVSMYAPLLVQYAFGGLLSGMLIFYGRSGDLLVSWPFLAMILVVIYFNETSTKRASRLIYNLTILFIGLFSYTVLVLPVLTGDMGPWIFVLSGVSALVLMYVFVRWLMLIVPKFLSRHMPKVLLALAGVFAMFNVLYFTNIIPPIPLSLKDVGIYHSVTRKDSGVYELTYEGGAWWQIFKNSDSVFHPNGDMHVVCFASVFAPTTLRAEVYHVWEYRDVDGRWAEHSRLSYPIVGGRDGGYRGYTQIQNFHDGTWRCSVETERGQVLGREVFTIDSNAVSGEMVVREE